MPLPLVAWGALAAALAAAAAAAVRALKNDLDGKCVLIVGPRGAGKSTLHALLTAGERTAQELGLVKETFRFTKKSMRMEDLGWTVDFVDSPTARGTEHEMAQHVAAADLVVFVADASLVTGDRYRLHCEQLAASHRNHGTERTTWKLVMTHEDQLPPGGRDEAVSAAKMLAKLLDEESPLLCDLGDRESSAAAVRHVMEGLR